MKDTQITSRFARRARALACVALPAIAIAACSSAPDAEPTQSSAAAATLAGGWKGWESLSGGLVSDPVIVAGSSATRDVFATGPDGSVYTRHFDGVQWNPGNGWWTNLGNAGNPVGPPAAVALAGGWLNVFVRDNVTHHLLVNQYDGTQWQSQGWVDLGGDLAPGRPTLETTGNGINVFATFTDTSVRTMMWWVYKYPPYKWTSLSGNCLYEPAAVGRPGTNHIDVFVAGTDKRLYRRYTDDGVNWNPSGGNWQALGGSVAATPVAVTWGGTNVDVYATAADLAINRYGFLNDVPDGWQFTNGYAFRNPSAGISAPAAISTPSGHVDLFIQGGDRGLWHTSLDRSASHTPFGNWEELTTCFRSGGVPSVVSSNGTAVDVVVTAHDASGNAQVWHDTSASGFPGLGKSSPPVCPCGDPKQPCCEDDACNGGDHEACSGTGEAATCVSVGALGNACRPSGTKCDGFADCDAHDTCVACGAEGTKPCQDGRCQVPGESPDKAFGVCEVPCGTGIGSKCCANLNPGMWNYPTCDNGFLCSSLGQNNSNAIGKCESCGGNGSPCCNDFTSPDKSYWCFGAGSYCDSSSHTCQPPAGGTCNTPPRVSGTFTYLGCSHAGDFDLELDLSNATCGTTTASGTVTGYKSGGTTAVFSQNVETPIKAVGGTESIIVSPNLPAGSYDFVVTLDHSIGSFKLLGLEVSDMCNAAQPGPVSTPAR